MYKFIHEDITKAPYLAKATFAKYNKKVEI